MKMGKFHLPFVCKPLAQNHKRLNLCFSLFYALNKVINNNVTAKREWWKFSSKKERLHGQLK